MVNGFLLFFVIILTTPPIALEPYKLDIPPSTISILSTFDKSSILKSILPANSPDTLVPSIKNSICLLSNP